MTDTRDTRAEDLLPVHSRVSWSALLAGMAVTLAVFMLLTAAGTAVGLSLSDRADRDSLVTGLGIWGMITALLAFFSGGCVTSRCTAGESKTEAMVYGTILWGATMAVLLWTAGGAVRTGLGAALGSANVVASADGPRGNWEDTARQIGLTREQINRLRVEAESGADARAMSARAAWWSLAALVASLLASVGGACASAGPAPAFGGFLFRRRTTSVQV